MLPPTPTDTCDEFGDTVDDINAFPTATNSRVSQYHAALDSIVNDLLMAYNDNPELNDGAREDVAAAFQLPRGWPAVH